jgi:hypothetical protein
MLEGLTVDGVGEDSWVEEAEEEVRLHKEVVFWGKDGTEASNPASALVAWDQVETKCHV